MRLFWQQIAGSMITDFLTESDVVDGVVLDTEHSYFDIESIATSILIAVAKKKECFVRVTQPDETLIRQCLDAGATGIICANVNRTKATKLKNICYYPPNGHRGLGLTKSNKWGDGKRLLNDHNFKLVAQIETEFAVHDLVKIRECGKFDYYMIGPYDLSMDLNCAGQFNNSKYQDALNKFMKTISKEKRGIHVVHLDDNDSTAIQQAEKQYDFICYGLDTLALKNYTKKVDEACQCLNV